MRALGPIASGECLLYRSYIMQYVSRWKYGLENLAYTTQHCYHHHSCYDDDDKEQKKCFHNKAHILVGCVWMHDVMQLGGSNKFWD